MSFEYSDTLDNSGISDSFAAFIFSPLISKELSKISEVSSVIGDKLIIVNIVNSKDIKALNSKFRGKNKPTDILTFEYFEDDLAGEIYLNIDEISENAVMMKHSLEREFAEIFVHGVLHMSGVDHSDYMFKVQKEYASKIIEEYNESISRSR